jgi:hypothetical protein
MYMIMSRHLNSGQNQNIGISNESSEKVVKFKYLRTTLTNQNDNHDENKSRLNSGNACYYSVRNLLSSRLTEKTWWLKYKKNWNFASCAVWVRNFLSLWGRNIDWGFLRTECWGEYLDLKGRKTDHGENCIMINFTAVLFTEFFRMSK